VELRKERSRQGEAVSARPQALERLGGGANQAGGRAYNERLALSLIRLNGPLPKAELARLTGLSAQTMSLIVRSLEADGLVLAQEPVRGRIGQPSVPYALNPEGVFTFGVKIGRRSAEIVLCGFLGAIRQRSRLDYAYPEPARVLRFVADGIQRMRAAEPMARRYAGIGIAMPFELWRWAEEVKAPSGVLEGWRDIDVAAWLTQATALPAFVANDATAACGAELAYCHRGSTIDLLYIFIGSFVGGGVALDGLLRHGRTRNAGALGSMPVRTGGCWTQLIQHASLMVLEKTVLTSGGDPALLRNPDGDWSTYGLVLEDWIARSGEALAAASVAGASIIDFEDVVIDGAVPRPVLQGIVEAAASAVSRMDLSGLSPFTLRAGTLGSDARALGGAMLPLVENYGTGQDMLTRTPAFATRPTAA
jgi:predicted NBD/HSP70 family sugar kinase